MLGQFYAKFYVDSDSNISFCPFDYSSIRFKRLNSTILLKLLQAGQKIKRAIAHGRSWADFDKREFTSLRRRKLSVQ